MTNEITVLLVEDDQIDVETVKRSFGQRKIANELVIAGDGIEALEILRGENGHKAIRRPLLILLDINMPRMSGLEFLKELRADEELRDLVVMVLTTSDDQHDIFAAYDFNVAAYILKSNVGDSFLDLPEFVEHYWKIVELKVD